MDVSNVMVIPQMSVPQTGTLSSMLVTQQNEHGCA